MIVYAVVSMKVRTECDSEDEGEHEHDLGITCKYDVFAALQKHLGYFNHIFRFRSLVCLKVH